MNQEEIFETPDITITQGFSNENNYAHVPNKKIKSEDIDENMIHPSKAFEVFMGKVYIPDNNDFSGELIRKNNIKKENYISETLMERFERIKYEITNLEKDITSIKNFSKNESNHSNDSMKNEMLFDPLDQEKYDEMIRGINDLKQKSLEIGENKNFTNNFIHEESHVNIHCGNLQPELSSKLIKEVQGIKDRKNTYNIHDNTMQTDVSTEGKNIMYELYSLHEQPVKEKEANNKIQNLDAKIFALEKFLGLSEMQQINISDTFLSTTSQGDSIIKKIEKMESKLDLLDDTKLQRLSDYSKKLIQNFQALNQQKDEMSSRCPSNEGESEKILEIYDKIKELDNLAEAIPFLSSRMNALKYLHNENANFSNRLDTLEKSDLASQQMLDSTVTLVKNIEESLVHNVSTFMTSTQELDKRIEELND